MLWNLFLSSVYGGVCLNGTKEACDGVCFKFYAVTETVFDKSSCFYYNWQ